MANYAAASGAYQWARTFVGTAPKQGLAVAVDGAGSVAVAGWFQGTVDFGQGALTSAGGLDGFVLKLSRNGVGRPR